MCFDIRMNVDRNRFSIVRKGVDESLDAERFCNYLMR